MSTPSVTRVLPSSNGALPLYTLPLLPFRLPLLLDIVNIKPMFPMLIFSHLPVLQFEPNPPCPLLHRATDTANTIADNGL